MTSPGSTASIGKAPLADLKSGLATAPTLFAAEEFPQLTTLINRKFEWEGDIELAVDLVQRSQGKITAAPRIHSYEVNSND
jgi:geranyl diphosphate synthase